MGLIMDKDRLELGKYGEVLAINFLKKNGYKIMGKNYRSPFGEIDIIALDKDTLAFIEVKTKNSNLFIPPELSVNKKKQGKIIKGALHYIKGKEEKFDQYRFDVIAINTSLENGEKKIKLYKDAFQVPSNTRFV